MGNIKSKDTIVEINFEFRIVVRMRECSFSEIMKAFIKIFPEILTDFIMKLLLGYGFPGFFPHRTRTSSCITGTALRANLQRIQKEYGATATLVSITC